MGEKRVAVVFPGVGYHADKPLLYYSREIAGQYGYEIICVDYGELPSGIKGNERKMHDAYQRVLARAEEQLSEIDFASYRNVLFLSKSIGTAVAAACDSVRQIGAGHVYYTPVETSFQVMGKEGIVFHGTGDDWADTDMVMRECKKRGIPLFLTEKANHSLEVGDVRKDLENLCMIMEKTERYIREFTKAERGRS